MAKTKASVKTRERKPRILPRPPAVRPMDLAPPTSSRATVHKACKRRSLKTLEGKVATTAAVGKARSREAVPA